ncbi:MAG TPA: hypothetical protein VGG99_08330 [Acetobacteraceae bacterium]|jgi:hypothetical protein
MLTGDALANQIIGLAIEVHRQFGPRPHRHADLRRHDGTDIGAYVVLFGTWYNAHRTNEIASARHA